MANATSKKPRDVFGHRLAQRFDRLSPLFQRVASFIDANRITVLTSSALVIARSVGTSDATVIRAVQALGFSGLQDLRRELATSYSQNNTPMDNLKRTLAETTGNIDSAFDAVLEAYDDGLDTLRSAAFRQNALAALRILHGAQRIVVFGIGPTAHIAAYFAARLRRKGIRQSVIDKTGLALADQLLDLAPGDSILMLSYGTPYREARATLSEALRLRLPVVLITDTAESELTRRTQAVLAVPRGRSNRIALHGATVFCLEMLLIGLVTSNPATSVRTLAELQRLRQAARSERRMPSGQDQDELDE